MTGIGKNLLMLMAAAAVGWWLYGMYGTGTFHVPDSWPDAWHSGETSAAGEMRTSLRTLYVRACSPLDHGASVSDEEVHDWLNRCETGYLDGTYSREAATAGWHVCRTILQLNAERRIHLRERERLSTTGLRVLARPNNEDKYRHDTGHFIRQTDLSWDQFAAQMKVRCERYLDAIE